MDYSQKLVSATRIAQNQGRALETPRKPDRKHLRVQDLDCGFKLGLGTRLALRQSAACGELFGRVLMPARAERVSERRTNRRLL